MRPVLYVVAKAPIMGRAKTRLAADIGPVHAKRIYRSLMGQVLRQVQDPRWNTVLAVTPPHDLGLVPDWEGFDKFRKCPDLCRRVWPLCLRAKVQL